MNCETAHYSNFCPGFDSNIFQNELNLVGLKFYIVMELYEENLEELYSRIVPDRGESIIIVEQITNALSFIHSKGYVHRDIKPNNILITGTQVALGDFGLCKRMRRDPLEPMHDEVGTPPYNTAPDEYLTHGFDIWSLGVMVFELFHRSEGEEEPKPDKRRTTLDQLVEKAKNGNQNNLKKFVGTKVKAKSIKNLICNCLKRCHRERVTAENVLEAPCFTKPSKALKKSKRPGQSFSQNGDVVQIPAVVAMAEEEASPFSADVQDSTLSEIEQENIELVPGPIPTVVEDLENDLARVDLSKHDSETYD